MNIIDIFHLAQKKTRFDIKHSFYLFLILVVGFTITFSLVFINSGLSNVLLGGNFRDDLSSKSILAREINLNIPYYTESKNNNILIAEFYKAENSLKPAIEFDLGFKNNFRIFNVKQFSFLDDNIFQNYVQSGQGNNSLTIPFLLSTGTNFTSKDDYDLVYSQLLSLQKDTSGLIALQGDSNLSLDQSYDQLIKTESNYKYKVVGKYSGIGLVGSGMIFPLSKKQIILNEFRNKLNQELKVSELIELKLFNSKQESNEFKLQNDGYYDFESPTQRLKNLTEPFFYLIFILSFVIVIITCFIIIFSINKKIQSSSQIQAMLECLGMPKNQIFLFHLFVLFYPVVFALIFSYILSLLIKMLMFGILRDNFFYIYSGYRPEFNWQPKFENFMEIGSLDLLYILIFLIFALILISIGLYNKVLKLDSLKSLKS